MTKIIAIGDLHGKDLWQSIVHREADKIIFLGDYVDAYDKTDEVITENLKNIIQFKKDNMDKVEVLLGNHDIQYYYSYDQFGCSGYRPRMYQLWHGLFQDNKELFKVAYQYRNYLFTHAGITKGWLLGRKRVTRFHYADDPGDPTPTRQELLNELPGPNLADRLNQLHLTRHYPQLHVIGDYRGGYEPWGGITWADIRETSGSSIDHYHQVVGHSKIKQPTIVDWGTGSITYVDILDKLPLFFYLEDEDGLVRSTMIIPGSDERIPILNE